MDDTKSKPETETTLDNCEKLLGGELGEIVLGYPRLQEWVLDGPLVTEEGVVNCTCR